MTDCISYLLLNMFRFGLWPSRCLNFSLCRVISSKTPMLGVLPRSMGSLVNCRGLNLSNNNLVGNMLLCCTLIDFSRLTGWSSIRPPAGQYQSVGKSHRAQSQPQWIHWLVELSISAIKTSYLFFFAGPLAENMSCLINLERINLGQNQLSGNPYAI